MPALSITLIANEKALSGGKKRMLLLHFGLKFSARHRTLGRSFATEFDVY